MKKLLILSVALLPALFCGVLMPAAVSAQPSPPLSPDALWMPPDEGEAIAPPVEVDVYNRTWASLQVPLPSSVPAGVNASIVNAYLVNQYGRLLTDLNRNEPCYLVVSFNGPGYFYLWEYYPGGSVPHGHWLTYRWYRPGAGVWRIGPFAAEVTDPAGEYIWKMWYLSGPYWSTRTLRFNYTGSYYLSGSAVTVSQKAHPPEVNFFSADKSTIDLGQTVVLSWSTSNATSVTISPGVGLVALSGSTTVTPASATTYTLTAAGRSGNPVSSSVMVTVMPRVPPTLTVDQTTVRKGHPATLSWDAPAALRVSIAGLGNFASRGSVQVSPEETTTYVLSARYIDGATMSTSVTVAVEQPPLLLYGLIALLAIASAVIVVLLIRRRAKPMPVPAAVGRGEALAPTAVAAAPADDLPATTPVVEAPPAKLSLPDGSEMLLAGDARALGRRDFEKFLTPDTITYISRQHINIWYEDNQYYIEDRSSTNGTSVNGKDIRGKGRYALKDGDVIDLAGKLTISFKK